MLAPGAANAIVPAVAFSVVFFLLGAASPGGLRDVFVLLGVVGIGIALFLGWFFRDPERVPGDGIVSAADGRVTAVDREGDRWRVVVFMNVTDVHVNRFPLDADVGPIESSGSGFRPAYRTDAFHNVQRSYQLATPIGPVEVVQLTGIVARRLVSLVVPGDRRRKGDRLGMIVLGSRVDVYLPAEKVTVTVRPGERVLAGISTIARVNS